MSNLETYLNPSMDLFCNFVSEIRSYLVEYKINPKDIYDISINCNFDDKMLEVFFLRLSVFENGIRNMLNLRDDQSVYFDSNLNGKNSSTRITEYKISGITKFELIHVLARREIK